MFFSSSLAPGQRKQVFIDGCSLIISSCRRCIVHLPCVLRSKLLLLLFAVMGHHLCPLFRDPNAAASYTGCCSTPLEAMVGSSLLSARSRSPRGLHLAAWTVLAAFWGLLLVPGTGADLAGPAPEPEPAAVEVVW